MTESLPILRRSRRRDESGSSRYLPQRPPRRLLVTRLRRPADDAGALKDVVIDLYLRHVPCRCGRAVVPPVAVDVLV